MKKCPNCSQTFSNDNYFCLNDGTSLAETVETGANPPPFTTGDSMPTQIISRPGAVSPNLSNDSSKWLFLIIGVLATALAGLAIFMLLPREKSEKAEVSNKNSKTEQTPQTIGNINRDENITAGNTRQNLPRPTITNPNLSPDGNWSGDLAYPNGTTYSSKVELTDDGNGQIRGKVVWTLLKTKNPKKLDKIGLSATEFVQGTFDEATRMLSINGYDKNDPHDLIILDKYRLTLAGDNRRLNGIVYGGKTKWNFNLRRF